MTIACFCDGREGESREAAEHGPLRLGLDVNMGEPLWCPAWPAVPVTERRSRALLRPRPKRFRVIRPAGQRVPETWHYSFVGAA